MLLVIFFIALTKWGISINRFSLVRIKFSYLRQNVRSAPVSIESNNNKHTLGGERRVQGTRLHGRRGCNDVHQCHMSKIADASGWDSCDVTQLFYNLQCIKIKLTQHKPVKTWSEADLLCINNHSRWGEAQLFECFNVNDLWMHWTLFYLFPFPKTVNEWSHGDDANTKKHVVLSHSQELLSVQSTTAFIISILGLELIQYLKYTFIFNVTNLSSASCWQMLLWQKEIWCALSQTNPLTSYCLKQRICRGDKYFPQEFADMTTEQKNDFKMTVLMLLSVWACFPSTTNQDWSVCSLPPPSGDRENRPCYTVNASLSDSMKM